MALVSPGVQVTVIDESFYTPAEPGTVPMIFIATAQDKANSSNTGTATGTLLSNVGKPFLITSQRELSETFGDAIFYTDSNSNPIHGGELNEYGLQAAYSFLGVSNRAYVVRAGVNLTELQASANAPAGNPASGTYWFDVANTLFGIFSWNGNPASAVGGQTFTNQVPTVITDKNQLVGNQVGAAPKGAVGQIGDYVINATTTFNDLYYKNYLGTWVQVGTSNWRNSHPTVTGTIAYTGNALTGSFTVQLFDTDNTTSVGTVSVSGLTNTTQVINAINAGNIAGLSAVNIDSKVAIFSSKGKVVLTSTGGTILATLGFTAGSYFAPAVVVQSHTQIPTFKSTDGQPKPTGSIWVKSTAPNLGAKFKVKKFNGTTLAFEDISAPLYANNETALYNLDRTGGGINIPVGDLYVNADNSSDEVDFLIKRKENSGATIVKSSAITTQALIGPYSFTIQESTTGSAALSTGSGNGVITVTTAGAAGDADTIAAAINAKGFVNVEASVDTLNRLVISHNDGGEIKFTDTDDLLTLIGFSDATTNMYYDDETDGSTNPVILRASNWKTLSYTADSNAPTSLTADGTLWYNSIVDEVDIMVHDGNTWVGYRNELPSTDPMGPIVSATEPTKQSDGSTNLVTGDLWIDTSDIENYPQIYKYNSVSAAWVLVDSSDQTTEDGIIFAAARYNTTGANSDTPGTIEALLTEDFVDFDAPDPALYPKGMLLFNTRRSGFNVKKFVRNYIDLNADNIRFSNDPMTNYYPHRWVVESANQENGAGSFGRKAQRKVVIQALQAMINNNDAIRDDASRIFNLMACPGYSELISEMISLNYDRGLSAFVIGDAPFRLTPDATSLNEWATNVNLAVQDNDQGLVSFDEYMGVFYPSGFSSDNFGNDIVVPASHMMLRTIALSDQVSFPWFAPAGTRRGGITNASSVGYITSEGEFESIALNEGQRDTLYTSNVNPITFITGAGLVNYGQKTRARNASALDRINVARLVIYLRSQLNRLAKPYVFEPNDKITRDEIKQQAESLLLELVGQRALYDFLVVCDESNNTPARIDRNELYLDIAIEPVKAVEFIYIPLRLKNTGEISGL
jgi:hypothetical protein